MNSGGAAARTIAGGVPLYAGNYANSRAAANPVLRSAGKPAFGRPRIDRISLPIPDSVIVRK